MPTTQDFLQCEVSWHTEIVRMVWLFSNYKPHKKSSKTLTCLDLDTAQTLRLSLHWSFASASWALKLRFMKQFKNLPKPCIRNLFSVYVSCPLGTHMIFLTQPSLLLTHLAPTRILFPGKGLINSLSQWASHSMTFDHTLMIKSHLRSFTVRSISGSRLGD